MLWVIGCILVCISFILMRFIAPHQIKINHRVITFFWFSFLTIGLLIAFLSGISFGFMAFGCFLWLYYPSFGESYVREINARFYGVPIFANQIAQNIGFILLLFGLILLFLKSWLYGIIGLGVIFLVIQLLKWLEH